MVSAWARENGLALGQRKVDAMGCQKEIAQTITEVKADYVLALKGNQSSLHEDVKCFMETSIANAFTGVDHDFLETSKKAHGRYETRRYWVNEDIKWLTSFPQWQKLRSVGIVESVRLIKGVETTDCGK